MSRLNFITASLCAVILLISGTSSAQGLLDSLKQSLGNMTNGGGDSGGGALSVAEIGSGLREALRVGAERVVGQVGKADGYNSDPDIHIPLPDSLKKAQSVLRSIGMSRLADDVELKLNRAAEAAAPRTKQVIWDAISGMSIDDAKAIYNGPKDAATQYFMRSSTGSLIEVVTPIINQTLSEVGAIASYDNMIFQYKSVPFVPDIKANLTEHTVKLALV